MKKKSLTTLQKRTPSHLKSLASYLKRHPKHVNFKLYDWLSTLETAQLARIYEDAHAIYSSFIHGRPMTRGSKDLAKAACLAYGAEVPDVQPEMIITHLDSLLRGMKDAAHIGLMARCEWVIVTERISIWPRSYRPYQVTQRGLVEGEQQDNPRTRHLLGLDATPAVDRGSAS